MKLCGCKEPVHPRTRGEQVKINGELTDGRLVPAAITAQPGYSIEGEYKVLKAKTGGYRLYKLVGSSWMDASLDDRTDLEPYAETSKAAAALGRKGGSVSSDAKTAAARENGKKGGWPKGKPRKPTP